MKIGALIIGDEILCGKRQDRHFAFLQETLAKRGLELSWTLIVGDDAAELERAMRFSMAGDDLVFSFGGIGATPDDRTRQTAANVKGVPLVPHPQAVREIEDKFGEAAYPNRILMGHLPEGCRLIPNPINRVAGFSVDDHHFMPGFPEMAWPMVEWLLDNEYKNVRDLRPRSERTITITKGRESDLLETMNQIVDDYPDLLLSSLPHLAAEPYILFSLRGEAAQVETAMQVMIEAVETAGFIWSDYTAGKN
ncbi:molybdopterin-binding protein [uncultured Methylophaga sp.]|uniref:competence/damage-inducible protein A n=1 Tax=uncultured Methylophaga sp. TaxID=285271 RepID=UPI002604837D|nr:molybdopterin-binding protein [uncultured Methylophaga sp.]